MKRNPYYQLQYIAGIPYLVTFGQGHADFMHDLRLNDTGAFLWEHLQDTADIEELAKLCTKHFHCSEQQSTSLRADITNFINALYSRRILIEETSTTPHASPCTTFQIAGLYSNIYAPKDLLAPELMDFVTTTEAPADAPIQYIYILTTPPALTQNGTVLIRNDMLSIMELEDEYILLFQAFSKIKEAHVRKDGKHCIIYCNSDTSTEDAPDISYVIRILFFYFALQNQIIALHSASILYRDKLWLFSAPSGTGKSTHAKLWQYIFHTPTINGDINLIGNTPNGPVVYGNPWCGTSGIYDTKTYALGGIFLLKQGHLNTIQSLSDDEKQLFLLHRSLSPTWTSDLLKKNHDTVKDLWTQILVKKLICTADAEAAYCCKTEIDDFLDIP